MSEIPRHPATLADQWVLSAEQWSAVRVVRADVAIQLTGLPMPRSHVRLVRRHVEHQRTALPVDAVVGSRDPLARAWLEEDERHDADGKDPENGERGSRQPPFPHRRALGLRT